MHFQNYKRKYQLNIGVDLMSHFRVFLLTLIGSLFLFKEKIIMKCKLYFTDNEKLEKFIGELGHLTKTSDNRYQFAMLNGSTITTSPIEPNTELGSVDYAPSRSVSFKTTSGNIYDFENVDVERLVDGCFREGNKFLGFSK